MTCRECKNRKASMKEFSNFLTSLMWAILILGTLIGMIHAGLDETSYEIWWWGLILLFELTPLINVIQFGD
jgi:hypothetical protein